LALAKYRRMISAKAVLLFVNIPLAEANGNDFYIGIKFFE
jgi:hypothetical protein